MKKARAFLLGSVFALAAAPLRLADPGEQIEVAKEPAAVSEIASPEVYNDSPERLEKLLERITRIPQGAALRDEITRRGESIRFMTPDEIDKWSQTVGFYFKPDIALNPKFSDDRLFSAFFHEAHHSTQNDRAQTHSFKTRLAPGLRILFERIYEADAFVQAEIAAMEYHRDTKHDVSLEILPEAIDPAIFHTDPAACTWLYKLAMTSLSTRDYVTNRATAEIKSLTDTLTWAFEGSAEDRRAKSAGLVVKTALQPEEQEVRAQVTKIGKATSGTCSLSIFDDVGAEKMLSPDWLAPMTESERQAYDSAVSTHMRALEQWQKTGEITVAEVKKVLKP